MENGKGFTAKRGKIFDGMDRMGRGQARGMKGEEEEGFNHG